MGVPESEPEHKGMVKKETGWQAHSVLENKKNTSCSGDTGRLNAGKRLTMEWEWKERNFEVEIEKNMQENNIRKRFRSKNTEKNNQEPCQERKLST